LTGTSSEITDQSGANALAPFATNASTGAFALAGGQNFTTTGNFTNNGTLTVGSGSTFAVPAGFSLTNFSGTTLTGGTYAITGTLQFPGANIVTNAANITLSGASSQIIDQNGANGLANFATNASTGKFTINSGRNFTTAGGFTNNGTLTIGNASTFNSAAGTYTNAGTTSVQSGGTFIGAGTLTSTGTFTNAGTLEAATGTTLALKGGSYANTGGTILASGAGSQVLLDGTTVTGGTLSTASSGQMSAENNASLNGSTSPVTLSSGSSLGVGNGQTLKLSGTLINNGAFSLNASSANTELLITSATAT